MLFRTALLDRIKAGDVTLAFRRWKKPTVKPGGRLRTAVGELAIDSVARCEESDISERDAKTAGFGGRDELLAELAQRSEGDLYRIAFRFAGADPRIALRDRGDLTAAETDAIGARLARLDASAGRRWTTAVLRHIADHEGLAAREIAAALDIGTTVLKPNIRKLKELGLTESLEVGYRISPRGAAVIEALRLRRVRP
ncbi:hypothetical protein [Sphingopyxis sp.]|uniref:hypothetical protein n=1 Tax=Sphingopyxis sp. TaxID=1908224 RepID=UPI002EDA680D